MSENDNNTINSENSDIRSINSLFGLKFFIPSYQRGYRWDKNQVTDLLNDISEFNTTENKKEGEFYCLQPIIVKKDDNDNYRLVDGQQRLTTIHLILTKLKRFMGQNDCFTLEYETRENSKNFLENISNEQSEENADYFYMSEAYRTIKNWFESESKTTTEVDFFRILANKKIKNDKDLANNVRVIWYEINQTEDEIEVFNRINSGKIPLTDAELIKALMLNEKNFEEKNMITKYELAKEWDEIEYALQDDEFWFFLFNSDKINKKVTRYQDSRITLLFEIYLYMEKGKPSNNDNYEVYRCFQEMAKNDNIVQKWSTESLNIKKIFLTLHYWYKNREFYHLIGFLLTTKFSNLHELYKKFDESSKKEFLIYLKNEIKNKLKLNYENLERSTNLDNDNKTKNINELNYSEDKDKDKISAILILFNIATILNDKSSYVKFAFDQFHKYKWSLEHIHAINQDNKDFEKLKEKKDFLSEITKELEIIKQSDDTDTLLKDINNLINKSDITKEEFSSIQNKIFPLFSCERFPISGEDIECDDSLKNLTLLTIKDNSALSNSIFPIKRKIIKDKDAIGSFVPICTKNVFMKYYSENIQNMRFWTEEDKKDYFSNIKKTIGEFLDVKL